MTLRRISVSIAALMVAIALSFLPFWGGQYAVIAQDPATDSGQSVTDKAQQRLDRIQERIERSGIVLDETRKNALVQRCQGAQQKITALQNRFSAYSRNRVRVYAGISSRLNQLEIDLQQRGADITQISQYLAEFNLKISDLGDAFDDYQYGLDDLAAMDCTADPAGFQATLQEARAAITPLKAQVQALHQYLVQEVRASFISAATSIETDDSADAADDGNQE